MSEAIDKKPGISLLLIAAYVVSGLVIFQAFSLGLVSVIYGIPLMEMTEFIEDPTSVENGKNAMLLIQGFTAFGTFILVPVFFSLTRDHRFPDVGLTGVEVAPVIYVSLLIVAFMMVNAWFIELNASITLPESLRGIEEWARNLEYRAEVLTQQLTEMDSFGYFLAALFVIAVIPGVGEELLFRGIVQNKLKLLTGNIHVAIWVSAVIFSAFHFQFFGFIPRMLLGALFGYIYYWSGSLFLAMLAHFIQNGFTLFMLYLYQNDLIQYDIDNTEAVPLYSVAIFTVISALLIYQFRNYYFTRSKSVV